MIKVPPHVLESLAACFGVAPSALTFLGGGREDSDGIVYTFQQGDRPLVMKVLALPAGDAFGMARMQERLKFVHFLGQHGVDIVYPLAQPDGSLLVTQPDGEQTFVAYAMEKVAGHHAAPEAWNDDLYRAWGRTVGKLHRITQMYPHWQYSPLDEASGQTVLGWQEEVQSFIDWAKDPQVKERWAHMRQRLEQLPVSRDAFGFIHNDPHVDNLLISGDRLVLLDFDVANYHWFISDISVAAQPLLFAVVGGMERPVKDAAPLKHFIEVFLQGYERENHLDPAWLDQLDLFISYRRLLLYTVLQGWLSTQPETKASWWNMVRVEPPVFNKA